MTVLTSTTLAAGTTLTSDANAAVTVGDQQTETLAAVPSPGFDVAMVAGIAAGGGAFLLLACIAACLLVRGRHKKKSTPTKRDNEIRMVSAKEESNQQYGSLDLTAKYGESGLVANPTAARAQAEEFDNDATYVPVPADAHFTADTVSVGETYGPVPDADMLSETPRESQYSAAAPAVGSMAIIANPNPVYAIGAIGSQ